MPVEFPDFSELRSARKGDRIKIPLNGQHYFAEPEPPADLVLEAIGAGGTSAELMAKLEGDPDGERLTTAERAQILAQGSSSTTRMLQFMQAVLEPESAERWAEYMRPVPITATAKERADHDKRRITIAQVKAVYSHLLSVYSGGNRPTEAPSSSNGSGATGTTSTGGASPSAEGSTP